MKLGGTLIIGAAIAALMPAAAAAKPVAAAQQSAHQRLFDLFHRSNEAYLKRNPLQALARGDTRYADRLGDLFSDAHFAAEKQASMQDLSALHAIPRDALSDDDKVAYDVFEFQTKDTLRGLEPDLLPMAAALPMNHFYGLQTSYPTLSSGQSGAPYITLTDYRNGLKRNVDFARNVDVAIAQWKKGEAEGFTDSKLTVRNMIEQINGQLKLKPEESPYWGPIKAFPKAIGAADRARLTDEYRTSLSTVVYPALERLRKFLRDEYLGHAREAVGLSNMKGGKQLYDYYVQSNTTLPMTPEEIHQLGLSEVARILKGFEQVQAELGFKGTLREFFDYMRTDPKFQPKTREQLGQDFYRVKQQVDAKIPQYFSLVPKTPLVIKPYPPFREKFEAGGSYDAGTPDGSRPGIFYYNAYDLPARFTWEETTLFLHEGEPGHHFQTSLAQENKALPDFMRFGGNTAYVEGWALYSETLGYDMGFYADPVQRFGTLNDEQLRAMRLVVDTGLHAKGWTRDQAIEYMLANSGESRTDATAEVERYIAIPGQAVSYKVGSMTIQRLRDKAKAALGPKFDIREFHAQVLGSGALPLSILEAKIDRWIESRK